jgi:hypothetical protein
MKNRMFSLMMVSTLAITGSLAHASDYPNYGIWNDQLSPAQALGRFQWMEKCYEGLMVEAWEKMFDVTTPTSTEEKINQLRDAWLYDRGDLRSNPQYPTFGDKNHENPEDWAAGTSANDVCKTIPRGYGMIGLLTSFDFKAYCPAKAIRSTSNTISMVSIGDFDNSSDERGYSNFSGRIVPVRAGETVRVVMTEEQIHPRLKGTWHVFVDWNRNGVLDDSGEIVLRNAIGSTEEYSFNLTIPEGATPGYTKMRITDDYAGGSTDPCRDLQLGEIEDYTLKIN